jgi:phosphoacetylglucosamine mutase
VYGIANDTVNQLCSNDMGIHLIAKTGVKYVHTMAHEHFDIRIYFEANGHGTVLFNPTYYDFMYRVEHEIQQQQEHQQQQEPYHRVTTAYQRLRLLPGLINQAIGDALSDLLLIDAILRLSNVTIEQWDHWYTDLPSRQQKIKVSDRNSIVTNENETKCLEPVGVQDAIDRVIREVLQRSNDGRIGDGDADGTILVARAFIRPSGTEDVVRIYTEASTRMMTDELCECIVSIVETMCGGGGDIASNPTTSKM